MTFGLLSDIGLPGEGLSSVGLSFVSYQRCRRVSAAKRNGGSMQPFIALVSKYRIPFLLPKSSASARVTVRSFSRSDLHPTSTSKAYGLHSLSKSAVNIELKENN